MSFGGLWYHFPRKKQGHPTSFAASYTLSYTSSFTGKCQQLQDVGGTGVGNVGFFTKLFLGRGRGKNHETAYNTTWKPENIGLLCLKHPYFLGKTSVLLSKEVRCFLISGGFHRSASSDFRILCSIYCGGKSRHPQGLIHIGRPCSL